MALTVKNPSLRKKVFKKLESYQSKAIRCYSKGNMKCGKKYERLGDSLYKRNYNKIFGVSKK